MLIAMRAVRHISVKERMERLQRELKDARNKAVSAVSRGNVCLTRGRFVTAEDLKERRFRVAKNLKAMH